MKQYFSATIILLVLFIGSLSITSMFFKTETQKVSVLDTSSFVKSSGVSNPTKVKSPILKDIVVTPSSSISAKYILYKDMFLEDGIVIFTSPRCDYCADVESLFDLETTRFINIDNVRNSSAWDELRIKGVPYGISIKNGVIVDAALGINNLKDLGVNIDG